MPKIVATFPAGTITNTCTINRNAVKQGESICIKYPARLEAMALDPAKIATNDSLVYTAGQIDVCVALFKRVSVRIVPFTGREIEISERTGRRSLVLHAALLMRQTLGIRDTLQIDVEDELSLRHCGLGSSSGTIAAVASAINELYGHPIDPHALCLYCAQNHGEELDGSDDTLVAVQCIGGSAVCGNYSGSLTVLAGEATPIMRSAFPERYSVVIGIPIDFQHPDSRTLMQLEEDNMDGFISTGEHYGKDIAYHLVHQVLPDLQLGKFDSCKRLIFDYRWNMGSIKNCSFVLPRINDIAEQLRPFADDEAVAMISLSSVGPGFFAVTSEPERISKKFAELDMNTYHVSLFSETYLVESVGKKGKQ